MVDQLARALNRRGHRPIVFASYIGGKITDGLRREGIAVVERLNQVGCTPHIIHGQHNVTTLMALAAFPRTPAVFVCHDFEAPKDRAPLLPRIGRYIAVDEACRDRLARDGAPEQKIEVLYNAVDLDRYCQRSRLPSRPNRALVLTKGEEHLAVVRSAAARAGLMLDELGSGTGSVVDDLHIRLPTYDIVIATARMAKEALCSGCAVVVCDHRGCAGLVTSKVLDDWRRHNFGRRILSYPTTEEALLQAFANYDPTDAEKVTAVVRSQDNVEAQVQRLEAIYSEILDDPVASDPARDLEAMAPFLEDFLISRDFSRPWVELYKNVTSEQADLLEITLHRHTDKLRRDIMQEFGKLWRFIGKT